MSTEQQSERELRDIIAALRLRVQEASVSVPASSVATQPFGGPEIGLAAIDPTRRNYSLQELTAVDDEGFITTLYRCLLKRDPDENGYQAYTQLLESGAKNKADIAMDLANSPEAIATGTRLQAGLLVKLRRSLGSLPVVGPFVRIATGILKMDLAIANQQRDHYTVIHIRKSLLAAVAREAPRDQAFKRLSMLTGYMDSQKASYTDLHKLEYELAALQRTVRACGDEHRVQLAQKAERTDVDRIAQTLSHKADVSRVEQAEAQFRHELLAKANLTSFEEFALHIRHNLSTLGEEVDQLAEKIRRELPAKASQAELEAIAEQLRQDLSTSGTRNLRDTVREIESKLLIKVDRGEFDETIGHILPSLSSKADESELQEVAGQIRRELLALTGDTSLRDSLDQLRHYVSGKADSTEIQQVSSKLLQEIDTKVDQSRWNEFTGQVRQELSTKASDTDLHHLAGLIRRELLAKTNDTTLQETIRQIREDLSAKADRLELATVAEQVEHSPADTQLRIDSAVRCLRDEIVAKTAELLNTVDRVAQEIAAKTDRAEVEQALSDSSAAESSRMDQLSVRTDLLNDSIAKAKYRIVDIERRVNLLLEDVRKRQPELLSGNGSHTTELKLSDSSYVDFEDIYRGTRDDIKGRQSIYLPRVQDLLNQRGKEITVVDLGCGRGEWLELLRDNGITAMGVDANSLMVGQCREYGFDVTQSDANDFLRKATTDSIGVITGFHIFEHLPLDQQLRLIDEALRALTSGGLIILETPNPMNLRVGSYTFYLDPTHIKPIPPQQLSFLLEARGFIQPEVLLLHPAPAPAGLDSSPEGKLLQDLMFGPQDYAVIARKA